MMSDALIHALLFDDSGNIRTLDWDGVRAWRPGDGILWLHLDASAEETRIWIVQDSQLPNVVPPALLADETRPRTSAIGDGAMIVLRGVNLNPGANPEDMVSIRLWVDAHRIVSTYRRTLVSVPNVVESHRQRPVSGTGDIVVRLADGLTERMNDVIDDLDDRVAELEQAVLQDPDTKMRAELADLRRDAIKLRRYLAPQREALSRLQGESLSWFSDGEHLRLREVSDGLIRQLEDLDEIRERAIVVQAELINYLSDQLNQRMYVLSIVAALFLPLGFLTGLLGVNVGGIPGAENPYGFVIFSAILIVLTAAHLWYFNRKRWF